jgi:hypothetical protein
VKGGYILSAGVISGYRKSAVQFARSGPVPADRCITAYPQSAPAHSIDPVYYFRSFLCHTRKARGGSYPSWWLFWETPDLTMSIWNYPGPNINAEEAKTLMIEIAKSI